VGRGRRVARLHVVLWSNHQRSSSETSENGGGGEARLVPHGRAWAMEGRFGMGFAMELSDRGFVGCSGGDLEL
jgi:hypothetical protein